MTDPMGDAGASDAGGADDAGVGGADDAGVGGADAGNEPGGSGDAGAAGDASTQRRRALLNRALIGLSGVAAAVVGVPIVSYLLSPLAKPTANVWRDLGLVDRFRVGETVEVNFDEPSPLKWSGQLGATAAWVRRAGESSFTAFAVNCTHLGCPVSWLGDARLFMCPCHGGVYYADGRVAGGPPPRPLFEYQMRVENGHVYLFTQGLQVP